jgi:hypothetical protein
MFRSLNVMVGIKVSSYDNVRMSNTSVNLINYIFYDVLPYVFIVNTIDGDDGDYPVWN